MARRADFLAANRGLRAPMPGFVLLVHDRRDGDPTPRLGITVTKKIGGAVIRNRMKRRFRALARALLPTGAIAGADHVLIGRAGGVERDYKLLLSELEKALRKLAAKSKAPATDGRGERRTENREVSRSDIRTPETSHSAVTQPDSRATNGVADDGGVRIDERGTQRSPTGGGANLLEGSEHLRASEPAPSEPGTHPADRAEDRADQVSESPLGSPSPSQ